MPTWPSQNPGENTAEGLSTSIRMINYTTLSQWALIKMKEIIIHLTAMGEIYSD